MIKPSPKDLRILSTYHLHGERSISEVAERAGEKVHTVRRVLTKATEAKLVQRRVFVNFFALGLNQFGVYLNTKVTSKAARVKIKNILQQIPFIELVIEVVGEFDFGLVVTVRSVFNIQELLDRISSEASVSLSRIHIQPRTGWYYFGPKYFDRKIKNPPIQVVPSGKRIPFSHEEALLLDAYCSGSTENLAVVSRKLGLPSNTVQYRVNKMKESGLILGVRYQLSPSLLGYSTYRALVALGESSREIREMIIRWAELQPYVVSLMFGVGNWQCELRIEAPDVDAATEVLDELSSLLPNLIEQYSFMTVSKVLKMKLHPDRELFVGD